MQEILNAFGIDWRLIVIQIFNFGILMGVLWYFLYTPILKILSERETLIKKGIQDAADAANAKDVAESEKVTLLKDAHGEAAQIVARGTAFAEEKKQKTIADGDIKAREIISKAHDEAVSIKSRAMEESDAEITRLALLGAEKILKSELSK